MAKRQAKTTKNKVLSKIDGWKVKHLSDAFLPRPPREYAVTGLFPFYSLNIVFGSEGSMKSLLMMDMGICISEGLPWLPYEDNKGYKFKTKQCNVLYVDCDNGNMTDDERINAFSVSHGLSADEKSAFSYISMPSGFDISQDDVLEKLKVFIQVLNIKVLIMDNLGLINSQDENSHDMAHVMGNLRTIADMGVCVIVVHHQRKSNGNNGKLGEMLRGHSSIAASLDFSYFISRKDINDNNITIIPTKSRFAPVQVFGAKFAFKWINGTTELETAAFVSYDIENEIGKAVGMIPLILQNGEMNKTQLVKELMNSGISQRTAKNAIEKSLDNKTIVPRKAAHNTIILSLDIDKWANDLAEVAINV